jgi:hypothetical protein
MLSERPHRSLCAALLLLLSACTDAPLDAPPGNPLPSELAETAWFPLPPDEEPIQCSDDYFDPICDDNDICTIDGCLYGICRHGPTWVKGCCNDVEDCEDANPCTEFLCSDENVCQPLPVVLQDCCLTAADCTEGGMWDDEELSTIDVCLDNQCVHTLKPFNCDYDGPMPAWKDDDENPCTTPFCLDYTYFYWVWTPGCCVEQSDCDDMIGLTIDECVDGQCIYTGLGACLSAADCDDENPCSLDECLNAQCRHTTPPELADCCDTDEECDDGLECTAEYCDPETNLCFFEAVPDQNPTCCMEDEDCDDMNPYTVDHCSAEKYCYTNTPLCPEWFCSDNNVCTLDECDLAIGECKHQKIEGCCTMDKHCDPDDSCILGYCNLATHTCVNPEITNCCETDSDCTAGGAWDDGDDCTWDICLFNECRHIKLGDSC